MSFIQETIATEHRADFGRPSMSLLIVY